MKNRRNNYFLKTVVAFAVALGFVMLGFAAFANIRTIGLLPNNWNTSDIKNDVIESSIGNNYIDTQELFEHMDSTSIISGFDGKVLVEYYMKPLRPSKGIVYVDDDRPPEWYDATHVRTIQEGVNNATDGDMVYVYNGTYYERVTVNKQLDLVGEIKTSVIVNGGGTGNGFYITSPVNNVNISNFTITNAQYGIYIRNSSNNNIINCNSFGNTLHGINIESSNNNTIIDSDVYSNNNHGIHIITSSNNNIINCNSFNNILWHGIYIRNNSSNNNIINCNLFSNKYYGIYIHESSNNNTIINCKMYNNSGHSTARGIYINLASSNKIINATINNNWNGICIRSGLDNVFMNCDIYNTTNYGIYIHTFANNNTILNSNVYNSYNNYGIYVTSSSNNNVIINSNVYNNYQYGIYATDCLGNKIINSNLYNHSRDGIMFYNSSNNHIENCSVFNNNRFGLNIYGSSNNIIINSTVYDNKQHGIYLTDSSGNNVIMNCNVYNNTFSGISLMYCSLYNNTIINSNVYNHPDYGIYLAYSSGNKFTNIYVYNNYNGIYFTESSDNNIIMNSSVYNNNNNGIYISLCSNNNITNSVIYNNANWGIYFIHTSNNILRDNIIYGNQFNFGVAGNTLAHYIHDINPSNTIEDKFIYYLVMNNNLILNESNNIGFLGLVSCTNITVRNADVSGVLVISTTYSTLINISIHGSASHGIELRIGSSYNNFTNCNVYNNYVHGIYFTDFSDNNIIRNCTVYNNQYNGIYFYLSSSNIITDSTVYNNVQNGIYLSVSNNNIITKNSVYNNQNCGIGITTASTSNIIYHNNVINNTVNACDPITNQWDNDYPSGGNYWSDYAGFDLYSGPSQNETGSDGIGDTPYNITGKTPPNQDRYPLMNPWDLIPPIITNVQAIPAVQNTTLPVNITCTVTDNWNLVKTVKVNITGPEGFTLETTMNKDSNYYYENIYTTMGIYYYYIRASDTSGNTAISDTYIFTIQEFEKPVSSVNPLPIWRKIVPFTITATAYDNTGVANVTLWYRYSSDGTSWSSWAVYGTDNMAPWSWSFTGIDGYYQFYSIAVDNYGNVEDPPSIADAFTGIDTIKPVTNCSLNGTMGENGWYISNVTVTLSATDGLSGVESTWYKIDTGYWQFYSAPFTVSGDGNRILQFYSFDVAGNEEVTNAINIKIDTKTPTTTHTLQGLLGSQGWYVTNVTVMLNASDITSGVNYTIYKLNDGEWILYNESFIVTENGNYTLYYYSVDFAGNTETTKQTSFRIQHDTVPPVTAHNFSGILGDNNWYISNVTITLSAEDDSSGVNFTMYKLDTGNWTKYTGWFIVTEDATHTLLYYSVDKVGNIEPVKTVVLKIDKIKPMINLIVEKIGLSKWLLTANVSDETSGVNRVEFYLNNEYLGEKTESPYEWTVTKKGIAQAIVYDNAGNSKVSSEVPVSHPSSGSESQSQSIPGSGGSQQTQSQSVNLMLRRMVLSR